MSKVYIPDSARNGGLAIFAASGWGKSRLMARRICYQDTQRAVGQIVLDPVGETVSNFCDKLLYESKASQITIGERIRYCNMAGMGGYTYQWPILSRRSRDEPAEAPILRALSAMIKTDVHLKTASIYGFNNVRPLLANIGIVLTVMQEPLVRAFDLLDSPHDWKRRLRGLTTHPEVGEAARDLLAFFTQSEKQQRDLTHVLRNKLYDLKLSQNKATYKATKPTVDWEEVANGLTLLLDWKDVLNQDIREYQLFSLWEDLFTYLRSRKRSDPPLALVIDELSFFYNFPNLDRKAISADFETLVTAFKRNKNIWLTVAAQDQTALPSGMLKACLSMGNLLFGATNDEETAIEYTKRWDILDPYKVKDVSTRMGYRPFDGKTGILNPTGLTEYAVTGETKTFMPLSEQQHLASRKYMSGLWPGEWYLARAAGEGFQPGKPTKVSTNNLDPGQYVNDELVEQLKLRLMQRDGVKIEEIIQSLDHTLSDGRASQNKLQVVPELAAQVAARPETMLPPDAPSTQERGDAATFSQDDGWDGALQFETLPD